MGKRRESTVTSNGKQVLVQQYVDNPCYTDGLAAAGAGQRRVRATINLVERIGGLARVKGLSDAHIDAAARYRMMWENAQLGAGQALDYGRVRVDTSGGGSDGGLSRSIDALEGYRRAVQAVGMNGSALLDQVVCQGMSLRDVARRRGQSGGGRAQMELARTLLAAVDRLVRHLNLGALATGHGLRSEGEAADWIGVPLKKVA